MAAACSIDDYKLRRKALRDIGKRYGRPEETFKWNRPLWFCAAGRKGRGTNWGETVCGMCVAALDGIYDAYEKLRDVQRLSTISLALSAYRAERSAYPERLSELSPKYIAELPKDPFGGEFNYNRRENGFRLYSIGPHEIDDGGKADDIIIEFPRQPPNKNP